MKNDSTRPDCPSRPSPSRFWRQLFELAIAEGRNELRRTVVTLVHFFFSLPGILIVLMLIAVIVFAITAKPEESKPSLQWPFCSCHCDKCKGDKHE